MADFNLDITHLCVGQGLSVLIVMEYTNFWGENDRFVALLDCGSHAKKVDNENCKYALEKLKEILELNNGNIDYVHISHFDTDHYNMLILLKTIYAETTIQKMVFGAYNNMIDKKSVEEYKTDISLFFRTPLEHIFMGKNVGITCHDPIYAYPFEVKEEQISERRMIKTNQGELYFMIKPILYHSHLIRNIRNSLGDNPNDGVLINTGSSILLVTIVKCINGGKLIPKVSFLFTGDATRYAISYLNNGGKFKLENEEKLIQIPHHGTRKHIADDDQEIFSILKKFLGEIKPKAAVVSAKGRKDREHPCKHTIKIYEQFIDAEEQGAGHKFTSFYKSGSDMMGYSSNMKKRIYQTCYIDNLSEGSFLYNKKSQNWKRQHIRMLVEGSDDSIAIEYKTEVVGQHP